MLWDRVNKQKTLKSCISQVYIRYMLYLSISQEYINQVYLRYISGIHHIYPRYISLCISGIFQVHHRYILEISRMHLGISKAYLRHILCKSNANIWPISEISQVYLRPYLKPYLRIISSITQVHHFQNLNLYCLTAIFMHVHF